MQTLETIINRYNVQDSDPTFDIDHFILYYDSRQDFNVNLPENFVIKTYYKQLYREVEADYVEEQMRLYYNRPQV